jgi:diguanylate cyclase (GGDEF)-like protein
VTGPERTSCALSRHAHPAERRLRLILTLLCICAASGMPAPAQMDTSRFVQTVLTDRNGLPQRTVSAIAQTRDGYLWFGTQEGLARYDGQGVTVFDRDNSPGLPDSDVQSLAASADGSLWIGTQGALTQLSRGRFRPVVKTGAVVDAIQTAADGTVWAATNGDGIYAVRPGGRVRRYTAGDVPGDAKSGGLPGDSVWCIARDRDGTMWFGTNGGVAGYSEGRLRAYGAAQGFPPGSIRALAASRDGSLWLASPEGLWRWRRGHSTRIPLTGKLRQARIVFLREDPQGTLWISFRHDGVAALRPGTEAGTGASAPGKLVRYTTKQGLPGDDGVAVFPDAEGNLWAGTLSGVAELRPSLFGRFGEPEGLSENLVWSVLQARDGTIWVGTDNKGLDHILKDGAVHDYTVHDGLPPDSVSSLMEDADGSLWTGSDHGELSHIERGRITVYRDPASGGQRLTSIQRDPSGGLWVGWNHTGGLAHFDHGRFRPLPMPDAVNGIAVENARSLWVATDRGGLSHFVHGVRTAYTKRDGLPTDEIWSVYVDPQGVVWAGTGGFGLIRLAHGRVTTFTPRQGLFNATAGAIVEDDHGYLWISCDKGAYKVSKHELNAYANGRAHSIHSTAYGLEDGLRSAEFNYGTTPSAWKGPTGTLWFATVAGIVSVQTDVKTAAPPPRILIEGVRVNQRREPAERALRVPPGSENLSILYAAPEFSTPDQLRFRYRLVGFDSGWVDAGSRREAYYTKVPPGRYTFEVQVANGKPCTALPGQLSTARMQMVFVPFFRQTAWFHALCAAALLMLGVAVYRLGTRYLLFRNRELEQKVELRTGELAEALQSITAAHEALHEQATRDGLTGLWNRQSIFATLAEEHKRAQSPPSALSVIMADIDSFKSVNDTYGHLAGDRVLREVARRIMERTRVGSFAGRYGGEEFVLVLPGCSLETAARRAEELRRAIADEPVPMGHGQLRVTCSFGVAACLGDGTVAALMEEADAALYRAKTTGRNRVVRGDAGTPPAGSAPADACP